MPDIRATNAYNNYPCRPHTEEWDQCRGLQRYVVYLCWPIAPSYTSPNARGLGGLRGFTWHGAQINLGDLPPHLTYGPMRWIDAQKLWVSGSVCVSADEAGERGWGGMLSCECNHVFVTVRQYRVYTIGKMRSTRMTCPIIFFGSLCKWPSRHQEIITYGIGTHPNMPLQILIQKHQKKIVFRQTISGQNHSQLTVKYSKQCRRHSHNVVALE